MKKISVITINLNNKVGLQKTVESVTTQTALDFEYIVIDGASTDGSVDVLNAFDEHITFWVSEPDSGIYNAMNKGIKHASGKYVIFLNSGDYFAGTRVLENVLKSMEADYDYFSGDMLYTDPQLGIKHSPEAITPQYMLSNFLPHPSTFIKTTLLRQRPYREDLKIVSDWEQMTYELICRDATYKKINCLITIFDCSGISTNTDKTEQLEERELATNALLSKQIQNAILHISETPNIVPNLGKYEMRIQRALSISKPLKKDAKIFRQVIKMFWRDITTAAFR